jgi:ribosomal protein L44E
MKKPRTIKRHCKFCNKHTEHKVTVAKSKGRNKAKPLSAGSTKRVKQRGLRRGHGNLGRYSKPPIKNWKSTGKKMSKKTDFRYECQKCKKMTAQKSGIRAKKLELV